MSIFYKTEEEQKEILANEFVPVGCGRIVTNERMKSGKAVEIQHYLCDELWNRGDKKIPEIKKVIETEAKSE